MKTEQNPPGLVPEHSLPLMTAMSGGSPLVTGGHLFFYAEDWLIGIGYPLAEGAKFDAAAFAAAASEAQKRTKAEKCFAIGPASPSGAEILETDRYYVLPAKAPAPKNLAGPLRKAAACLTVRQSEQFAPGHRRLWAEFMERAGGGMNSRVAELYARTPQALAKAGGSLFLLDAIDQNGDIAASMLFDRSQPNFLSYILGAHSRAHYAPHAADLLFATMLEIARQENKRFIHLGLGVNEGILRFKKKWGAIPSLPFVMWQWAGGAGENPALALALAALRSSGGVSARRFLENEPEQKPFAMLWELEKNGRVSYIAGTAHFFRYSFENSFRSLFRKVDNVIFEGPLDPDFMAAVENAGQTPVPGQKTLLEQLEKAEIDALEKTVQGGLLAKLTGSQGKKVNTRQLLANCQTWYAFFTLWTAFLERRGWRQSVDMEAWRIAQAMGKNVLGMESLEEQLESLGSLPQERALRFFRDCGSWNRRARRNLSAYLAGDLEKMMGSSAEFPTRTEHIVGRRDQRFRERMRPWLEEGRAAVFVGAAHMVNLRQMLAEDGFRVRQKPFGIWPKLRLRWRSLIRPDEKATW